MFWVPPYESCNGIQESKWWLISNEKITAILHVMQLSNVTSVFTKSEISNQFYILYRIGNDDFTIDIEHWIRIIVLMI